MYTAPFIWIPSSKCQIDEKGSGYTCFDRFDVRSIVIEGGNITSLEIINEKTGNLVFSWSKNPSANKEPEKEMLHSGQNKIDKTKQKSLEAMFKKLNINAQEVIESYGAKTFADLTEDDHFSIVNRLKKAEETLAKREKSKISKEEVLSLVEKVDRDGVNIDKLMTLYKVESFKELSYKQYDNILANWGKIIEACKK